MKNGQKIIIGVLAAAVVFSGSAAAPVFNAENTLVNLTASAADDTISISNGTQVPDTLEKGTGISVQGVVTSASSNLKSVTVGIYDSSRKLVNGKSALPTTQSYNISKLDSYVSFDTLQPGTYTYMVFATNDTSTNYILVNKSFTVTGEADAEAEETTETEAVTTLSIANGSELPAAIKKGSYISIKGTVASADSDITSLTVGVYDTEGTLMTGKTVAPNKASYSVANLDANLEFNILDNGNYVYKVIATNADSTDYVLAEQAFVVTDDGEVPETTEEETEAQETTEETPTVANTDVISIDGATELPDSLKKGQSVLVQGTVTSAESNLEALTVGIYDVSGKLVTGKTAIPNATTYDISKLDSYIAFDELDDGTYVFMIFASNSTTKNFVMVNKTFTVGDGGQVASDALTVTGGTELDSNIAEGSYVSIKGTVTSAESAITSLTVGVYDADGEMVTGKTVTPNQKTYSIANVDEDLEFNKLSSGSYTYKVIATNDANQDFTLVSQKFTVVDEAAATDLISIANGTNLPDNMAVGSVAVVKGTVTSAESNLSAVTVGVYDTEKKLVTGKTAIPNAKTYNIAKLDNYVEFDKLEEGTYYYMVFASNDANTNFILVNKQFTVGDKGQAEEEAVAVIANGSSIPESINKGKAVTVKGTVTSEDTIQSVTVTIYDADGNAASTKSATVDAKTYNLYKLDNFIEFDKLDSGAYTYEVSVTTDSVENAVIDSQTFNVK